MKVQFNHTQENVVHGREQQPGLPLCKASQSHLELVVN